MTPTIPEPLIRQWVFELVWLKFTKVNGLGVVYPYVALYKWRGEVRWDGKISKPVKKDDRAPIEKAVDELKKPDIYKLFNLT